jgi:hypothetical protein
MAKLITPFTPEALVELVVLAIFWQWDPASGAHTWSTTDKTLKILTGLGCITEAQARVAQQRALGRPYQRAVFKNTSVVVRHTNPKKRVEGEVTTPHMRAILEQPNLFCVNADIHQAEMQYMRLIRNTRLHLTYQGAGFARELEAKYASFLTRGEYADEERRRDEMFKNAAGKAAASNRYRQQVAGECDT